MLIIVIVIVRVIIQVKVIVIVTVITLVVTTISPWGFGRSGVSPSASSSVFSASEQKLEV